MPARRESPSTSSTAASSRSKSSMTAREWKRMSLRCRCGVMRPASFALRPSWSRSRRSDFAAKAWPPSPPLRKSKYCHGRHTPNSVLESLPRGSASVTSEPVAAPVGTRVRAVRLFEELPVRREYLRSAGAEFNRISSWLSSFALAYPAVTFTLRHDGKEVWVMPSSANEAERLAMVFGRDAARALLPLDGAAARLLDGRLRGFVSAPGNDRPDRRMQLLFVNGRLLRSSLLSGAWTSGYATYTMIGRHAVRRALSRFGARASRSQRPSDQERRTAALR